VNLWVHRLGAIAETPDGGITCVTIGKYCLNTAPQRIPVFYVSSFGECSKIDPTLPKKKGLTQREPRPSD
jgi:hypothetical protein